MSGCGPGLDVSSLRALLSPRRDLELIRARIAAHIDTHEGYLAFSGGKDSLVVLHLALQAYPGVPVVFFDSGLEFPETYRYLAEVQQQWRFDLDVIQARPSALEILAGCGAWDHHRPDTPTSNLFQALIGQPASIAHDRYGPGELWGVRAGESRGRRVLYRAALAHTDCGCAPACVDARRRARHGGEISRHDGTVAYGPVWDWTTSDVWDHIARHNLPLNPVYDKLRRLGAPETSLRVALMVDANQLSDGRITWLRRGWPELFDAIASVLPRLREFT